MPDFRTALTALDDAAVPHCVRNGGGDVDALPAGGDLDVLVPRRHLGQAEVALTSAGFRRLTAPGHRGHRFFVAVDEHGAWRKVDVVSRLRYGTQVLSVEPVVQRRRRLDGVWAAGEQDERAHRERRAAGLREPRTVWDTAARRLPPGVRRRGPVVAVLGPDGAGKGSTLAGVRALLPVGLTTVYLGNQGKAAGARAGVRAEDPTRSRSAVNPVREAAFLVRKALPVWRTLATAYAAAWRGHVVLCDRHPVEVLAVQPRRTPLGSAVERLLFVTLVPRPDRVVVLDAPGEVLFGRKGEHDPETLERWRQGYLSTFVPPGAVVDTTGALADSVQALLDVLWSELCRRNGWFPAAPVVP